MIVKIPFLSWTGKAALEVEIPDGTEERFRLKLAVELSVGKCADLRDANLRGANLRGKKIKTATVFAGLYDYIVIPYITEDGEKWIKMGCHNRILSDWESDFWNNPTEFPDNGSVKSNLRLMAFETAKKWFEIIEKQ